MILVRREILHNTDKIFDAVRKGRRDYLNSMVNAKIVRDIQWGVYWNEFVGPIQEKLKEKLVEWTTIMEDHVKELLPEEYTKLYSGEDYLVKAGSS